jgi:hypothetical protein
MKKLKHSIVVLLSGLAMATTSCYTFHGVTNNPVGTKVGKAAATVFSPSADFSFQRAAKKGGIDKIGTYEFRYSPFGITTIVTGE